MDHAPFAKLLQWNLLVYFFIGSTKMALALYSYRMYRYLLPLVNMYGDAPVRPPYDISLAEKGMIVAIVSFVLVDCRLFLSF